MSHQDDERIPEHLTDTSRQRREQRTRRQHRRFLKGPIPTRWLKTAAGLTGRALEVGLALWYKHGLLGQADSIAVTNALVQVIGPISRKARYRALNALEKARLVAVTRQPGRAPRAMILDVGEDLE